MRIPGPVDKLLWTILLFFKIKNKIPFSWNDKSGYDEALFPWNEKSGCDKNRDKKLWKGKSGEGRIHYHMKHTCQQDGTKGKENFIPSFRYQLNLDIN